MSQVWVEVVGPMGTVGDGRDLKPGEITCLHPAAARRLLAMRLVRLVEPPVEDKVVPQRARTR